MRVFCWNVSWCAAGRCILFSVWALPSLSCFLQLQSPSMSFFRVPVWFVSGLRRYTKSGYAHASKSFDEADLRDASMAGKSVMITGSNSGIGKEVSDRS